MNTACSKVYLVHLAWAIGILVYAILHALSAFT